MSGKPVKSSTRPGVGKPSISRDTVPMAGPAENEESSSEDEYPPPASQGDGSQSSYVSSLSADDSQRMDSRRMDSQDMELPSVDASAEPTTEPMIIAIENQLLEPIGEDAVESDDTSTATGISAASLESIQSLANSVKSLESSGFTMVPAGGELLDEFYRFWDENQQFGYTAVMVAFISFAYSKGVNGTAITAFFNRMNPGLNLRLGGADIRPITEVISNAVNQPGKAAGGSGIMSGITNGIKAIATAVATSVATVIGTNMVVEEPLTIDNVTTLLFEFGEIGVNAIGTVPEFISRLTVKVAALKALYKIRNIEREAIEGSETARIQNAIEAAAGVLNAASAADRARNPLQVGELRTRVNAIINTLNPDAGPSAGPGAGASAGPGAGAGAGAKRGGKRQSQKQQKQKQQKKTQKQHKKLSKSKRAKKAKQSKKANKKH